MNQRAGGIHRKSQEIQKSVHPLLKQTKKLHQSFRLDAAL
jgi:hypothetical protein